MSRVKTLLLCAFAIAAIAFLAIYEPLTRSTREDLAAARKGFVLNLDPSKVRAFRPVSANLTSNEWMTAGSWARNRRTGRILPWSSACLLRRRE